jgi:hypothetical protein
VFLQQHPGEVDLQVLGQVEDADDDVGQLDGKAFRLGVVAVRGRAQVRERALANFAVDEGEAFRDAACVAPPALVLGAVVDALLQQRQRVDEMCLIAQRELVFAVDGSHIAPFVA